MAGMTQQQILDSYGLTGWQVIGEPVDEIETQKIWNQQRGGYDEKQVPTGNFIWTVTGPGGEHDQITVQPSMETRPGVTAPGQELWNIAKPPKRQPPKPTDVKPTPSPVDKLEPIYDPNNPSRVIKMRDPATNTYIDVPDVPAGAKPTIVTGERGQKWSWDGVNLKELTPATPKDPQLVQGQGGAIYTWDGTTLSTLQGGKPEPKENDERPNVKDGYHVKEKFVGGDWVVISYGDPAKPGEPTEGMERPNVKEGYKVTERFSGGDWTVTNVGERATPREPQTITTSTEQPYIVRTDAQGNTVNIPNPNYVAPAPKTGTDVAARIGQIQTQANAKKDELMKKVGANYTADQALQDFNGWWDQNVQGQLPALQAAQEEARFARGKEIAEQRRLAQTNAIAAGTQAINQYNASSGEGLDPEFGKLLAASAAGKRPEGVDYSKMFATSGLGDKVKMATAEALKYIDQDAAAMTGAPPPSWMTMNPADALNRTSLWGTGPAAAGPPAAPGTPAPPPVVGAPVDQPGSTGGLFHATPIITNPQGGNEYQIPFVPADEGYMAQQAAEQEAAAQQAAFEAQQAADLEAMMAGGAPLTAGVPPYRPPARRAPVRRAPTPVSRAPFNQQALAAGLGGGGVGPGGPAPAAPGYWPVPDETYPGPNPFQGTYVPPNYLYGGQYATPTPY